MTHVARHILKGLMWVVLLPICLVVLAMVLVYLPPIQDFAVRKTETALSEATGWRISIDRVRLTPWLDVDVRDVLALDETEDTLLRADHLVLDLSLCHVRNGQVEVEELSLRGAQVNTKDIIEAATIKGRLRELVVGHTPITADLDSPLRLGGVLDNICLDGADLDITLHDTPPTPEDSTAADLALQLDIREAHITDTHLRLALSGDSMVVRADIAGLSAKDGVVDLQHAIYGANVEVKDTHLDLFLWPDSIHLPLIERLTASIRMDSTVLRAKDMVMQWPGSMLKADAVYGDSLTAHLETTLSKTDLFEAAHTWMPEGLEQHYPDVPLAVGVTVSGALDDLHLERLDATLPGSLALEVQGSLLHLTDTAQTMTGDVAFNVHTKDLNWLRRWLGLEGIRLPEMALDGEALLGEDQAKVRCNLHEDSGLVTLNANLSPSPLDASFDVSKNLNYTAHMRAQHVNIDHFLPEDSLGLVTLEATAQGHGAKVEAEVELDNALATLDAKLKGDLNKKNQVRMTLDVQHADLHGLGVVEDTLTAALCMDADVDMNDGLTLTSRLNGISLQTNDTILQVANIHLDTRLGTDTTIVSMTGGDLLLNIYGKGGYEDILKQVDAFTSALQQQIDQRRIDQDELKALLPDVRLTLNAAEDNPVHDYLKWQGMDFEQIRLGLHLDPIQGINGGGHIHRANTGSMLIDTLMTHIYMDSVGVKMDARICNNKRNPQFTFDSRLNAYLLPTGAGMGVQYYDSKGKKGIDLGAVLDVVDEGYRVHLDPLNPILAYRTFHLNEDNYIMLGQGERLSVNLDMLADDGTGLKVYSTPNEDALQDISVAFNHFNLGELTNVLPYLPRITGLLNGDAHLIQTSEHMSVAAELNVNEMTLEGSPLGQIGLQAVYLPNNDGSHYVDGSLLQTGIPVATFAGSYIPTEEEGLLDIEAALERFPLSMANGFLSEGMARLEGYLLGDISVTGSTEKPQVNGALMGSEMRLMSDMYSLNLRLADDTITIRDNDLQLNRLEVYSTSETPLIIDGSVNFADLGNIRLNTTIKADNYELMNAKKTQAAVAYGKIFVDINAALRGTLDELALMGRLKIRGNSDFTYVLKDSPLTVEDELADLVTFVDFEEEEEGSSRVEELKSSTGGLRIHMDVGIDNTTQIHCLLSDDGNSYVNLEGGGDLTLTSSPGEDMQLRGRYTINSGTLKYTMMIIPLKSFSIKSGSYVDFRGPILNPSLDLSATDRVRSTITQENASRSVNFDVGLAITGTLNDMNLDFTIQAPEDANIAAELASMSAEQRSKAAVTMLATGMYLSETGTTSSGTSALNAFLQSQISNLTNKAIKGVDLTLGVDVGEGATGGITTDYSYRFAKRFWGNRISVVIGGSVSTGNTASDYNVGQSLIDNISIEYRLDKSATRYVNLFYNKDFQSVLDGEVIEMGAGLVLRKKSKRLGELFIFKKQER